MPILPFESFTITTYLSFDEVIEKLADAIEPPRRGINWTRNLPSKPYRGILSANSFKMSRVISYRNSFLPVIEGRIEPQPEGCLIRISLRLHEFVMAFMIIWLSNVGGIGFLGLIAFIADPKSAAWALIPFGMFLFGYLLCTIPFNLEAKTAKADLTQLLGG